MPDNLSEAQRANLRLDHINGDIVEIKESLHEQNNLLSKTREELASLKSEVRIIGAIMLGAIGALIALVLSNLIS